MGVGQASLLLLKGSMLVDLKSGLVTDVTHLSYFISFKNILQWESFYLFIPLIDQFSSKDGHVGPDRKDGESVHCGDGEELSFDSFLSYVTCVQVH